MFSHSEQLFETYLIESSNNSPEILKDLVLNIKPSNQILSNVLDICKNTACISFGGLQWNFEKISVFIDRSWFTQESNGQKYDWLALNSSFSSMYLKRGLNISLSKVFPKYW